MKEKIDVYDIRNMHKMFTLNLDCSLGRFALSPSSDNSFLSFSTDLVVGKVTLYNLSTCTQEHEILAHDTPIVQMIFNERSSLLATVSCNVLFFF